jgi:hypothetical protein
MVSGKKDLVYGESLGELAPGRVQLRLLLVDADENVAEPAFDTERAGRVQADLGTVGCPQEALTASRSVRSAAR